MVWLVLCLCQEILQSRSVTRLSLHILISCYWVRCLISVNRHGLVQAERHLEAMLIYTWQEFDA